MTYGTEEKQRFIELRAVGMSFDRIAQETGISKPTLLKFQAELKEQIQEQQYFEMENIVNSFSIQRRNRFEAMACLLARALQELRNIAESPALETMPVEKILQLVLTLEQRLEKDTKKELLSIPGDSTSRLIQKMNSEFLEIE